MISRCRVSRELRRLITVGGDEMIAYFFIYSGLYICVPLQFPALRASEADGNVTLRLDFLALALIAPLLPVRASG